MKLANRPGARTASALAACLLLASCGIDETYTGMGTGALPGDPLKPDRPALDLVCNCPGSGPCEDAGSTGPDAAVDVGPWPEDLTGLAWRFDSLTLTAPLSGLIAQGLNDYFRKEIEEGRLHILLAVDKDDRDAGVLTARVGAGDEAGGVYSFTQKHFPALLLALAGALFDTSQPSQLSFPTDQLVPPALPISRLELSGRFALDGSAVADGGLVGALTVFDAQRTTAMGQTLEMWLAEGMQTPPDLDLDGDGTKDAWRFEGAWSGVQVKVK